MKKCLLIILILFSIQISFADNGKVHEYQLKNSLKVIVKEDHRAPVAIAEVWYKVGSSYEPLGITGISHALEHMMFRGSENFSKEKMTQIIAENGIQQNAFTFYDYTAYYEIADKNKLPIIFAIEADRMRYLLLTEQDFEKEIQIVMEERRMRTEDNSQQQTFERFLAAAYIASPYHHAPIGWMGDLQNMKVEDLRQWYKTWYAPNNAILVVVGDVDPSAVYQLAQKYFDPLKSEKIPTLKPVVEAKSLGMKSLIVEVPAKLPYLLMGYNVPTVTTAKTKWEPYALSVLAGILSQGDSSRLQKDLVRGKQIASAMDVDYQPYFRLDNLFYVNATPNPGHNVDQVKEAVFDEIKQLQEQLVTPQELERVKAQVIANKVYMQDDIANQANQIGGLEAIGLPWQEADNFITQINKVTAQQVQAVAQEYLIPRNLTVAILKPLPLKNGEEQPQLPVNGGDQYVH